MDVFVVDDIDPVSQRRAGPPSQAAAQDAQGVSMDHERVVSVHGVFQDQHPVAVEHAIRRAKDVRPFKHLRGNIFFGSYRLSVTHPYENQAFQRHRGELPCLHAGSAGHLGVRAFGEEGHAVAVAVKSGAVIGTGDESLKVAFAHGKVDRPVGAPVQQSLHLALLVPEENHVGAQHPEHGRLALLNVLFRKRGIPIFAVTQRRNPAAAVLGVLGRLEGRRLVEPLETPAHLLVAAGIAR